MNSNVIMLWRKVKMLFSRMVVIHCYQNGVQTVSIKYLRGRPKNPSLQKTGQPWMCEIHLSLKYIFVFFWAIKRSTFYTIISKLIRSKIYISVYWMFWSKEIEEVKKSFVSITVRLVPYKQSHSLTFLCRIISGAFNFSKLVHPRSY